MAGPPQQNQRDRGSKTDDALDASPVQIQSEDGICMCRPNAPSDEKRKLIDTVKSSGVDRHLDRPRRGTGIGESPGERNERFLLRSPRPAPFLSFAEL